MATRPADGTVTTAWQEISINTYAYKDALYTDAQKAGHPYPLLNRDRVASPQPQKYRVLRMRNEYLELTLLPELGGRIYQVRYLPTNQDLLYNNAVLKPSRWGPPDQGWWLAAGGIEFCLPVDEHGYVSAEPWEASVRSQSDGSATATMRITEKSRNVQAQVEVTLRPREAAFELRTNLRNPDAQAKSLQFWINAMLAPGSRSVQPSLRFYYPTSEVVVHSRGDSTLPDARAAMSWPLYAGRDMSQYGSWRNWLGFFVPTLSSPFTAVYDESSQIGMVRVFPPEVARGVKLFGFGLGFGDAASYTDDNSQYVEMWGGLTPTFWDYATVNPSATIQWQETWYVLSKSGGPSVASARASLRAELKSGAVAVTVASPSEQRWVIQLRRGNTQLASRTIQVKPESPLSTEIAIPANETATELVIDLLDATGKTELSFRLGPS